MLEKPEYWHENGALFKAEDGRVTGALAFSHKCQRKRCNKPAALAVFVVDDENGLVVRSVCPEHARPVFGDAVVDRLVGNPIIVTNPPTAPDPKTKA